MLLGSGLMSHDNLHETAMATEAHVCNGSGLRKCRTKLKSAPCMCTCQMLLQNRCVIPNADVLQHRSSSVHQSQPQKIVDCSNALSSGQPPLVSEGIQSGPSLHSLGSGLRVITELIDLVLVSRAWLRNILPIQAVEFNLFRQQWHVLVELRPCSDPKPDVRAHTTRRRPVHNAIVRCWSSVCGHSVNTYCSKPVIP